MPFCTSCRAEMDASAQVCPSCGKAVSGGAPQAAAAAAAPQKSGGALKIILLVLGGMLLLGIVGIMIAAGTAYYFAKQSHVEQGPEGAKVETPFGSVETSNEGSAKMAEKMGVEVYPGAKALPGGASVNLGNLHSASAMFETDDPPEQVAEFYHKQFPHATVTTTRDEDEKGSAHTILAFGGGDKWTTITIEGHEGGSKIVIASVEK